MEREIEFYSEKLKKTLRGKYVTEGGTVTVHSAAGTKATRIGASQGNVEYLVRMLLEDLEIQERKDLG